MSGPTAPRAGAGGRDPRRRGADDGDHGGALPARAVGDLLSRVLGPRALAKKRRSVEAAREAWVAAAGTELSGHTRVASLRSGILMIEVDSPPLCHRLAAFEKETLLLRLKERLLTATVTELRFRLGAFAGE